MTAAGRALVVTAHPDDVDFVAGGTVATWVAAGIEVTYLVLTDGTAGGDDPAVPDATLAAVRRAEQAAAAKVLGVGDVRFLGYPDGELVATPGLRRDIARVVRQVRPHRVLIPSPEINWAFLPDLHPDHRAAGEAALAAVYPDARNPRAHPDLARTEGLAAWAVPEIWVMTGPRPDHFVDVTDVVELKVAALRAHASQTGALPDLPGRVRSRLAGWAAAGGLPAGRLAEAFQLLRPPAGPDPGRTGTNPTW